MVVVTDSGGSVRSSVTIIVVVIVMLVCFLGQLGMLYNRVTVVFVIIKRSVCLLLTEDLENTDERTWLREGGRGGEEGETKISGEIFR